MAFLRTSWLVQALVNEFGKHWKHWKIKNQCCLLTCWSGTLWAFISKIRCNDYQTFCFQSGKKVWVLKMMLALVSLLSPPFSLPYFLLICSPCFQHPWGKFYSTNTSTVCEWTQHIILRWPPLSFRYVLFLQLSFFLLLLMLPWPSIFVISNIN